MKTSMLEYVKTVLQKVSFDRKLFKKEYLKSTLRLLRPHEAVELRRWAKERYAMLLVPGSRYRTPK